MQDVWKFFVQGKVKLNLQYFGDELMKKHLLRITFFVLSLAAGIGFVRLLTFSNYLPEISEPNNFQVSGLNPNFENDQAVINGQYAELGIKFKEFVQTNNGLAADFEITNYSQDSYIYSAGTGSNVSEPVYTQAELMTNGEKFEQWRCGTGYSDFDLKSGETKIFRYPMSLVSYIWKKDLRVQIGFFFRKRSLVVKEYKTYWSEILPINEEVSKQLFKEQKR